MMKTLLLRNKLKKEPAEAGFFLRGEKGERVKGRHI
jgi:hypothetical protein